MGEGEGEAFRFFGPATGLERALRLLASDGAVALEAIDGSTGAIVEDWALPLLIPGVFFAAVNLSFLGDEGVGGRTVFLEVPEDAERRRGGGIGVQGVEGW